MPTREPEEIRQDIEHTREQLGETVEALAGKADADAIKEQAKAQAKAQAQAKVDETKARFSHTAQETKERITGATPEQARAAASSAAGTAKERPVPVAVAGAFAVGLVLGLLIARRRR